MHVKTRTLSADLELQRADNRVQFIDPDGAGRIVHLPPVYVLDGVSWVGKAICANCECNGTHIMTQMSAQDLYYFIFNLADAVEDLTIKYWKAVYLTQSTECNGTLYHDFPVLQSNTEYTVMTISQNEGGKCFSNGIEWRGFVSGTT